MTALSVAKIYSSITQTIPDNANTQLTFNSVEFDSDGYRSGNTFVVPAGKDGVHVLMGGTFSTSIKSAGVSAPTADLLPFFQINGTTPRGAIHTTTQPNSSSNPGQPVGYISFATTPYSLAAGDVITAFMYIDNSGTSMVFGHATSIDAQTWIAIVRLAT